MSYTWRQHDRRYDWPVPLVREVILDGCDGDAEAGLIALVRDGAWRA